MGASTSRARYAKAMALPYRDIAREWCDIATGYPFDGVTADDAIYREVTEWRDPGPGYSSCADLAHWLLYRLGVRADWINRDEHQGYRSIVNVARLVPRPVGSNPVARAPIPGERFACGDVIVAWARKDTRDAHVMIVEEHSEVAGVLCTWDYGQGPMAPEAWRAHRDHLEGRRVTRAIKHFTLGNGKTVHAVIPLLDVLAVERDAGRLAAPDLPPNWSDDGSE